MQSWHFGRVGVVSLLLAFLGCSSTTTSSSGPSPSPEPNAPASPSAAEARSELTRDASPSVDDATLAELVAGNTAFSADIFRHVATETPKGENVFLSGYGISGAFAMLAAGARGDTQKEIAKTFHFTIDANKLHPAFDKLALEIESRAKDGGAGSDGKGFRLAVDNSFWGEKTLAWERPYLDVLATSYGAGINLVDYRSAAEPARAAINAWTEAKTEGRIKELLPAGSIDEATRLVMVNTVYFNAAWASPFESQSLTFHGPAGDASIDGMRATGGGIRAGTKDGTSVVAIPYEGGDLELVAMVPASLDALEQSLDGHALESLLEVPASGNIALTMPKFTIDGDAMPLVESLQALGLRAPFERDAADLSGITKQVRLSIDDVRHKGFVKVNEKGTEAAAATGMSSGGSGVPVPAVVVTIDRPFLFVVRDVPTKTVLFTGRVVDPHL